MKNRCLIPALVLAFFAVTSCSKESYENLSGNYQVTVRSSEYKFIDSKWKYVDTSYSSVYTVTEESNSSLIINDNHYVLYQMSATTPDYVAFTYGNVLSTHSNVYFFNANDSIHLEYQFGGLGAPAGYDAAGKKIKY